MKTISMQRAAIMEKGAYTHDYPNDTTWEYTVDADRAQLELVFASEDPDYGSETLIIGGDAGESLAELARDLLEEVSDYLDGKIENEFLEDNYIKTSLYAFEGCLKAIVEKCAKEEAFHD